MQVICRRLVMIGSQDNTRNLNDSDVDPVTSDAGSTFAQTTSAKKI